MTKARDINDYLMQTGAEPVYTLEPMGDPDETPTPDHPRKPVEIVMGPDLERLVQDVTASLGKEGELFVRGGLVVIDNGLVREVTADRLLPILSRHASFVRVGRDEEGNPVRRRIAPSRDLARMVVARGSWPGLRPIEGVTRSPVLRSDGSVVTTPGYDAPSRLVYLPAGPVPAVPSAPTRDDAIRALALLGDVVSEYPFATSADRSAWFALVLTLAARTTIRGCTPFFAVIANQARTGKTTLVQHAGLIALGDWPGTIRWPSTEDELGKRVDALVLGGAPMGLFDNLRGAIVGTALEAAVTTTTYTPRILGSSTMPTAPQRTVFSATANGATLGGDMPGRTLPIRLHCPEPHPERRTFRRADLRSYVEDHQVELHAAALTVASAYLRAGGPAQDLEPWGSFEAWSRLVRGALVWAGQPDPCDSRSDLSAMDLSGSTHDRLVACIEAVFGRKVWTAGQLADQLTAAGMSPDHDIGGRWTARDAHHLAAEVGVWDPVARSIDARRLGEDVRGRIERPALNGTRIAYAVDDRTGQRRKHRTGVALYTLEGGPTSQAET